MNAGIALLTGLTAGGLGCLAVQGGLLASSLAFQLDLDLHGAPSAIRPRPSAPGFRIARPILLFLLAKLVAYSALGFLLGACGSLLQITPRARAGLMILIGLFMLGNGLRLLNVHPIFRRLVIEPPAAITGFIRRTSKKGALLVTPLFLGSLTVLLPCGVSQAMMAAALATGDPLRGAVLLFAFTLGTMPLFFFVTYSAARLGATLETQFRRIVALILIALGAVSCVFGLNLAGVPVVLPRPVRQLVMGPDVDSAAITSTNGYKVLVSAEGYRPAVLHLPAGRPVTIIWITRDVTCCAQTVVIPGLAYEAVLPSTGETPLAIPAQKLNAVLDYSCSMGRRIGHLVFDRER
jgi:uncharacterized protein